MQLLNILLLCLTTAIVMHSSHNVRGTVNAAMSMKVRYPDKDGKAALPKGGPHHTPLPHIQTHAAKWSGIGRRALPIRQPPLNLHLLLPMGLKLP